MTTVALAGSTGLVGGNILTTLSNLQDVNTIHAFARRELTGHAKLKAIVSSDTATWAAQYPQNTDLLISSLGTTRANAGGLEAQRKVDYDLALDLAKAAKAAGTKAYVLISTAGASSASSFAYPKMKGELEEAVKALGFDHTVIVRPGLIVGARSETRMLEGTLRKMATLMGSVSGNRLKDFWAQDADVIAKAAVRAGLDCVEGKQKEKNVLLSQSDIVRLGRTEWVV
ncbi:Protein fmp52, mitochondrial [Elasticomyces elasticus]|nr:Protein fmp52, mitochondrial [Elasticomyces elasticus]KAK3647458.1 Protein fmp52, mitochondrial [Elasticomyces elasticus]KAK4907114.1 Protein fmp52, mitochondrial [Elasticomyces elasticus]KAK5755255.1 Protein fmp52, mitochondrial [Elasticomyces elasticus]